MTPTQGGKYGIRLSLGADQCDVYNNVMSDNTRYGVFFFQGSDDPEVSPIWVTRLGSSSSFSRGDDGPRSTDPKSWCTRAGMATHVLLRASFTADEKLRDGFVVRRVESSVLEPFAERLVSYHHQLEHRDGHHHKLVVLYLEVATS